MWGILLGPRPSLTSRLASYLERCFEMGDSFEVLRKESENFVAMDRHKFTPLESFGVPARKSADAWTRASALLHPC
jgi:hypothetical protein